MFRMLIEKSKALLPESSAFFELLGFAILASGIFSGLALITYDPTDSIKLFATDEPYQNMIGPAGAVLADFLLSTFGLVSFLIASILIFWGGMMRSEEHTSELQSRLHLVCRLLLEKKKKMHCD